MDEITSLLNRMRQLEPEVYVYGPQPEPTIQQLEAVFGQTMPPSYRAFLTEFGGISVVNSVFSGITQGKIDGEMGRAWTDTLRDRKRWQLPPHYLIVAPDEDGPQCLDFSHRRADGECPVIYFMPFRTAVTTVGPDYGTWLTDSLRSMIKAWEESP